MKYNEFRNALDRPYFGSMDILLRDLPVYGYQLTVWRKKGYIERLKRGKYFFTERKNEIISEEVSFFLYEPSYVSLESALSYYGLIPEMVPATTAVSSKTTRKFHTAFGLFSYRHVQPKLFFGYTEHTTKTGKYLLAEPEKAILDYIYLNLGKLNNKDDVLGLRINGDEMKNIVDKEKLQRYLSEFRIQKMEKITSLLFEVC